MLLTTAAMALTLSATNETPASVAHLRETCAPLERDDVVWSDPRLNYCIGFIQAWAVTALTFRQAFIEFIARHPSDDNEELVMTWIELTGYSFCTNYETRLPDEIGRAFIRWADAHPERGQSGAIPALAEAAALEWGCVTPRGQ